MSDTGEGRGVTPIVIICGERSGVVRDTFLRAGVPAISCDLDPSEAEGPHIIGDWMDVLRSRRWQLAITHYTCTALSVSGNHVYAAGKPKHDERLRATREAEALWRLAKDQARYVAFENPRGVLGTQSGMGKATQSVQPYEFGDDASKLTDLWLWNLPPLTIHPALRVAGRLVAGKERWANQTDSGQNRLAPSAGRAMERARTYQGIADAIVRDWSPLLQSPLASARNIGKKEVRRAAIHSPPQT